MPLAIIHSYVSMYFPSYAARNLYTCTGEINVILISVSLEPPCLPSTKNFINSSTSSSISCSEATDSLPYYYDNNRNGIAKYSEAEKTLSYPRDWTEDGVSELSLWFRGRPVDVGSFVEDPVGIYTITGSGMDSYLGLFGQLESGAKISNIGLQEIEINGTGNYVGGLTGLSYGSIATSYCTGSIKSSGTYVGGLVGSNSSPWFTEEDSRITNCYSTAAVSGNNYVGGIVGSNSSNITTSYSNGIVNGNKEVGGLVGKNSGIVFNCFWDIETSGLLGSDGGIGLTTPEMMDPEIIGLNGLANDPNWVLDPGKDYPRVAWENTPGELIPQPLIDWLDGDGTPEIPYQITNIDQLIRLSKAGMLADRNFILKNDLDLEGLSWFQAVIPSFSGSFNGNSFSIQNVSIQGGNHLGLIGILRGGSVTNLGLVNIYIESTGNHIGGLVGKNDSGTITHCYSSGSMSGEDAVGGMIGYNLGAVNQCYSTGEVNGNDDVGGLVGRNGDPPFQVFAKWSTIYNCYSTATVTGNFCVGGLAGTNNSDVTGCYSTGIVNGSNYVGGLVGTGDSEGVNNSVWDVDASGLTHSTGGVGLTTVEMMNPEMLGLNGLGGDPNWVLDSGQDYPRLVWEGTPGQMIPEPVIDWLDGSGSPEDPFQIKSADQILLLHKSSLLWDKHFVLNADIDLDPNLPGRNVFGQAVIPVFKGNFVGNDHMIQNLQIEGANNLGFFGKLTKGCVVRNLGLENVLVHGSGSNVGGLVGYNSCGRLLNCYSSGEISGNDYVGGVVGCSLKGTLTQCYSTGSVDGNNAVGGLVGFTNGSLENNGDHVINCYSTSTVSGVKGVGGLVGEIYCPPVIVDPCDIDISPNQLWLITWIPVYVPCKVTYCYSTGLVSGSMDVGGLIGEIHGPWENVVPFEIDLWDIDINIDQEFIDWFPAPSYYYSSVVSSCFWDTQNSGKIRSAGGIGKTTAEMQTTSTFLEAGWDFVDEVENGIEDIWWIDEGNDYPRLWWERSHEVVIDDFESYDDLNNRIYYTWRDGFGHSGDPDFVVEPFRGNNTGCYIGHLYEPYVVQTIAYTGSQSMPFLYDNDGVVFDGTREEKSGILFYSEAERIWETAQDWTVAESNMLTLYFLGQADNDSERLYVAIEDTAGCVAVVIHPDPDVVLASEWQRWDILLIDLQAQGSDVTSIKKIYIGVGDRNNPHLNGTGRIYIDDIKVVKQMP